MYVPRRSVTVPGTPTIVLPTFLAVILTLPGCKPAGPACLDIAVIRHNNCQESVSHQKLEKLSNVAALGPLTNLTGEQ